METEINVIEFIENVTDLVGGYYSDMFSFNVTDDFDQLSIKSPIEQLFYCALEALREINDIEKSDPIEVCGKMYLRGLEISPQKMIGKYRVDFMVTMHRIAETATRIIVECDSQEWHERTEKERRYEKRRDRYFVQRGYHAFHFTGKEIKDNPYRVAKEVLAYILDLKDLSLINMPA